MEFKGRKTGKKLQISKQKRKRGNLVESITCKEQSRRKEIVPQKNEGESVTGSSKKKKRRATMAYRRKSKEERERRSSLK